MVRVFQILPIFIKLKVSEGRLWFFTAQAAYHGTVISASSNRFTKPIMSVYSLLAISRRKSYRSKQPSFAMRTQLFMLLTSVATICSCLLPKPLLAQSVPNVPFADYYLSRSLLQEGRTQEAAAAFQSILRSLNIRGRQLGLESIPVHVMLGECLYAQGNLGLAMENYDAALSIAMAVGPWPQRLGTPPLQANRVNSITQSVNWVGNLRGTKTAFYPPAWPFAFGTPGVTLVLPTGDSFAAGQIITVDAIEIFRCQAIALRRRNQILGPLASDSPLTAPLTAYFAQDSTGLPPLIRAALNSCAAISSVPNQTPAAALRQIQSTASLPNNTDYAMTPVVLLAAADAAIKAGDLKTASVNLLDTTRIAGLLEQYDVLAEAVEMLAGIGATTGDSKITNAVQGIGKWSQRKSRRLYANTLLTDAEFLLASGDLAASRTQLALLEKLLSAKELFLPRLETYSLWLDARIHASDGQTARALEQLTKAIALYRGGDQVSSTSPKVFQLRLLESLVNSGQIKRQSAIAMFADLLQNENDADWFMTPVESLVFATTNKNSAIDLWLSRVLRNSKGEEVFEALQTAEQHLIWSLFPLGGRSLTLRKLLIEKRSELPPDFDPQRLAIQQSLPALTQLGRQIDGLLESLAAAPLQLDLQDWNKPTTQTWNQLDRLSATFESQILATAAARVAIPKIYPYQFALKDFQSKLEPGQVVLKYFTAGAFLYSCIIEADEIKIERAGSITETLRLQTLLLRDIGVGERSPTAQTSFQKQKWKESAEQLKQLLFPNQSFQKIANADEIFLVPAPFQWSCPFELFTVNDQPLIAHAPISYSPSLCFVAPIRRRSATPPPETVIVNSRQFFVDDRNRNDALVRNLLASINNPVNVSLDKSDTDWQPSQFARTRIHRAIITANQNTRAAPLISPLAYDPSNSNSRLSFWLTTPQLAPEQMALMGLAVPNLFSVQGGRDLFEIACLLSVSNNHSVVMSRWPVRGHSTEIVTTAYLEDLDFENSTVAWQRAIETLWATDLISSDEPVLGRPGKSVTKLSGAEPIFWASYIHVGESVPK